MISDHIARLSTKLLATPLAENGEVVISSIDYRDLIPTLPSPLKENAFSFVEEIRTLIPSDFQFTLWFVMSGIQVGLEFDDGNTSSSLGVMKFTSRKSLLRKLRHLDWDEARSHLIQQSDFMDGFLTDADKRPAAIPSSEIAATQYAGELKDLIAAIRAYSPLAPFSLIVARDDAGISNETYPDRGELIGTIGDRMTTHCDILAVLENGVQWPYSEIEAAKLEAVEFLGPISRAKAERRYF
jgi:hypothetical protein